MTNDLVDRTIERTAVVIGSGIAGLLAARVLVDHFDRVKIIERDQPPSGPEVRAGAPQARHVHVLLMRGQQVLEQLFPGLQDELAAAGAPAVDWTQDCRWFAFGKWLPPFRSQLVTHLCSRDLLEWSVRRRLVSNRMVTFAGEREVIGFRSNATRTRITGVQCRIRNARADTAVGIENIDADLVVDASGRGSKLPTWLESLGYTAPAETKVNAFLGYSTRIYEPAPSLPVDWQALLIRVTPPETSRGGGIYRIEGNRWLVTLSGAEGDYPPTDEAGFLEFARSLPSPALYDAIKNAQPLTPIYGFRRTENSWRHYERLNRLPENIVALGDSVSAFNPVYGQGMTVAAMGALALGNCLRAQRGDLTGLTRRFQKKLARVLAIPWALATSADFLFPATEGDRPGFPSTVTKGYMHQLGVLAFESPRVFREFFAVLHLLKSPIALFQPNIAAAVVRHAIKARKSENNVSRIQEGYR